MNFQGNKQIGVFLFLLLTLSVFALECSVCNRRVKGKYFKNPEGDVFCSKRCLEKAAPRCAACGKPCAKEVYTALDKKYCSRSCLAKAVGCDFCGKLTEHFAIIATPEGRKMILCSYCAKRPRCYSCGIPNRGRRLADGRFLCAECERSVLISSVDIEKVFRDTRLALSRLYRYDYRHPISFKLVTPQEMEAASPELKSSENSLKMALMTYSYAIQETTLPDGRVERTLVQEKCSILALSHVPRELLIDAIAHELTHDYLRHRLGYITDLKMEEGFAEAMAGDYNRIRRMEKLNVRKEINPDPIYGDGYREMSRYLKANGFSKTLQLLRTKAIPFTERHP